MDLSRYLSLIIQRTFRQSINLTDRASILIGPIITAYFWLRGGPMPNGLDGLVAVGVLLTAGAALLLRLIAAPFLTWKEDQARLLSAHQKLDDPKRDELIAMKEYSIELRKQLSENMAKFLQFAQLSCNEELFRAFVEPQHKLSLRYQKKVMRLLWQLSHDVLLRVACWNLVSLCSSMITNARNGEVEKNDAVRLRSQARFTMKLIHNPSGEDNAIALAQLESVLSEYGESIIKSANLSHLSPQDTEEEKPL